ncbi:MAG: Rieske 2Fe-2S domain-containing protein [Candidatus Binatia bacterium]
MSQADYSDFVHTGPGTIAGRYLRHFWQPVSRSEDLPKGEAAPIRIMSEDFTLYRGESGKPYVVAFRCAHRGAQLSTGSVEEERIRCMYHGWKYEGSGQCVEQPGEEEGFAAKIKIRSWPAEEYLGLIFVYFGAGKPPPLPKHPDFERPGVLETGLPEYWPCNYFNRLDNACDVGHVTFTHRESALRAGRQEQLAQRTAASAETEYGIKTSVGVPGRPAFHTHFHMPNTNQTRSKARIEGSLEDAATLWVDRLFWRVPVDDENSVSFVVDWMPLTGEAARQYKERRLQARAQVTVSPNEYGERVLAGKARLKDLDPKMSTYYLFWIEDYAVQVGQGRIAERSNEHLGRMDGGVILLRKIWQRELRNLAEGKPLKEWMTPAGLNEPKD